MKRSNEIQFSAMSDAVWGSVGWLVAVVLATAIGFCVGYWCGYGHITSVTQTVGAFCHLPLLWLGSGWVFVAYAVTGLAWRLPAYFESLWNAPDFCTTVYESWVWVRYSAVGCWSEG